MKKLTFLLLLTCFWSSAFAQNWDWGGPLDPLQAKMKIRHYRLELELFPESQRIQGSNTITFSADEKLDTLRFQLIDEYEVSKVLMDGRKSNSHTKMTCWISSLWIAPAIRYKSFMGEKHPSLRILPGQEDLPGKKTCWKTTGWVCLVREKGPKFLCLLSTIHPANRVKEWT
ncbi:MAG: hypothetical protein MUE75_15070 [Algoriphagus sp.]|nr:hypothetical protein [Algoriphagus sp.]